MMVAVRASVGARVVEVDRGGTGRVDPAAAEPLLRGGAADSVVDVVVLAGLAAVLELEQAANHKLASKIINPTAPQRRTSWSATTSDRRDFRSARQAREFATCHLAR